MIFTCRPQTPPCLFRLSKYIWLPTTIGLLKAANCPDASVRVPSVMVPASTPKAVLTCAAPDELPAPAVELSLRPQAASEAVTDSTAPPSTPARLPHFIPLLLVPCAAPLPRPPSQRS